MNKRFGLGLTLALILVVAALVAFGNPVMPAEAAPAAAITPVGAVAPIQGDVTLVKFYDGEALTADDQACIDLREYRTMDLEFVVDQTAVAGVVNTTTVTLEHTNGAGATNAVNTTGQTVVSANTADADDLNRFDLYGVLTCVDINLSNTQPVTWTVYGLARK